MLIGRQGSFVLLEPFNKISTTGLNGKIVAVAFIKHMVSRGTNVEQLVYKPVEYTSQYSADLARNVIIVTIEATNGKKYYIPDIYIENLYDDNVVFVDAYMTVCLNKLPLNTDFAFIRNRVATAASEFSGVQVSDNDVSISISDRSHVYTYAEAQLKNEERNSRIENLNTDYGRYRREVAFSDSLSGKLKSLENKVKKYIHF